MARLVPSLGSLAAGLTLALGCNTDAAVFVAPTIETPSITVTKEALGTKVTGGFTLKLHLGARASGASQVTLTSFSLKSADQKTTYVDTLPFQSDKPSPIAVAEDSDTNAAITIDTGANLLPAAVHDTVCAGGQIVVSGVLQDSLETAATPFVSAPFAPSGC